MQAGWATNLQQRFPYRGSQDDHSAEETREKQVRKRQYKYVIEMGEGKKKAHHWYKKKNKSNHSFKRMNEQHKGKMSRH